MAVALDGSRRGIPVSEALAMAAEIYGYDPSNTRFRNNVIKNYNRALLEIWNEHPQRRRFKVHDAEIQLQSGVEIYDVRESVEDGGWGWTYCEEIIEVFFPNNVTGPVQKIGLDQFRLRQDVFSETGPPETLVIIDNYHVRMSPNPDQIYTGKGDYFQSVPYLTTGRVDWPYGWDVAALDGCIAFLAQTYRPWQFDSLYKKFLASVQMTRRSDQNTAVRPQRAQSTRARRERRAIPHDNSADVRFRR